MDFRLEVPKSVTLNDLERRNGHYFALFQVTSSGGLHCPTRSVDVEEQVETERRQDSANLAEHSAAACQAHCDLTPPDVVSRGV